MKEIKWILYTLFVAGYTSLIWAVVVWRGMPIGPNEFPIGLLMAIVVTMMFLIPITAYIAEHWKE